MIVFDTQPYDYFFAFSILVNELFYVYQLLTLLLFLLWGSVQKDTNSKSDTTRTTKSKILNPKLKKNKEFRLKVDLKR